jgi:hypothetical protein
MPSVPPKAKLTAQQKERIAFLAQQGMSVTDIAKECNIHGQQVAGYTRTLLNFGGKASTSPLSSPETDSMANQNQMPDPSLQGPASAPPPAPQYQAPMQQPPPQYQQPQPPPPDGWTGGRPAFGYSQGFTNPAQTVRYQIERKMPADGIVGFHTGHFTEADLCQNYGEGLYRVLRFEPGRPQPFEFEVKAGSAFGPPRNPKYGMSSTDTRGGSGDRPGLQRPFARPWENRGEEESLPPPPPRPAPYYDRGPDRSLYEFARGNQAAQAAAANDVTAEAIRQLGDANKRALDQAENARKGGPDAFVTNFFQQQQDLLVRRMEEDRKSGDARRREDDQRWENRQREVEAEYKRRQDDEERKHNRDLERLRIETEARAKAAAEERKTLLDLEDKKLALIREEGKLRQDMLAEELKSTRLAMEKMTERNTKEMQDMKEQTSRDIESSQASIQATLEKDREALEREHKLKEKSLDKEHELSKQILDIKQEALSNQGGDQIFNLLNTLVKEASKGLEKIVDLQRLQSMTPEAQVAHVGKAEPVDANVPVEPKRGAQGAQPEMSGSAATNGNGNGHAAQEAAAEEDGEKLKMEQIVQAMVEQPAFKQVIKEWSRQVSMEEDPTTFANMYLEWMRDPVDSESRKGCSMFANFMKTRTWDEMLAVIGPRLDKDVLKIFKTPFAADFYEGFKAMVIEQVRAYWEDFMASRKAQQAAKTAAEPAPAAAVAEEPASAPAATASPEPARTDRK